MATDSESDVPERQRTDESLRQERAKTDEALEENKTTVEQADDVVRQARDDADAVMVAARERADSRFSPGGTTNVARERALADELVQRERATADEALRAEREVARAMLSKLLPLERDRTDRFLLTERRRSDDVVAHRDDFLGIVSHDLRNLLAGIVTGAALLSKRAPSGDFGATTLAVTERIQRFATRMNRLIGDLQDIGSIDAGRLAMIPERGDLTSLVIEVVDTYRAAAEVKDITLVLEEGEHPLIAEFDHDRMLQVLANVISNAIKFTERGGRVVVHCERAGEVFEISVADDGVGIPSTMLESVFERFWQVGKNDRRGLGLGLYISRCIVEAHGGKIWAESKPGVGSRFRLTLPAPPSSQLH